METYALILLSQRDMNDGIVFINIFGPGIIDADVIRLDNKICEEISVHVKNNKKYGLLVVYLSGFFNEINEIVFQTLIGSRYLNSLEKELLCDGRTSIMDNIILEDWKCKL